MRKIKIVKRDRRIYKFQSGGKAPGTENADNAKFMNWYVQWAEKQGVNPDPNAKGQNYDYRGYWDANKGAIAEDSVDTGHLPDTYKMPGHPTFSTQSIHSNKDTPGGTWDATNTKFTHSAYTQEYWEKTAKYLNESAENNETSYLSDGTHVELNENGEWPTNKMYPGVNQNKFNDYVDQISASRDGVRENPDGTHSTHIMMNADFDEGGVAYPSLYQRKDKTWYTPDDPVQESKNKGEGYKFDSSGKASWFARGSWKSENYDREKGKFRDKKGKEAYLIEQDDKKKKKEAKIIKAAEKKARGGILKFEGGALVPESAIEANKDTEKKVAVTKEKKEVETDEYAKDWEGNQKVPGIDTIHDGYQKYLTEELGENVDMDEVYKYFAAVGMHEGRGNRTQRQISGTKKKGFKAGPASGVYQIEDQWADDYSNSYEKFHRLRKIPLPKWYSDWKSDGSDNISDLGKGEQLELMMSKAYFATDRKQLVKYLKKNITAGELAASTHKRVFKPKGKKGEVGYVTAEDMRVNYVDEVNKLYGEQDADTVNNVIFNNKWKTSFPNNYSDSKNNFQREEQLTSRCSGGTCEVDEDVEVVKDVTEPNNDSFIADLQGYSSEHMRPNTPTLDDTF